MLLFLMLLLGCVHQQEKLNQDKIKIENIFIQNQNQKLTYKKADYHNMFVYEIKKNSIMITPPATDPTAQYPAYEIFVDENTDFRGKINDFQGLEIDDLLQVWTSQIDNREIEIATTIIVHE